jgi:hypothetical protein
VPCYGEHEARDAIASSLSYSETLRKLGLCATGGNWRTLRLWTERWAISTDHFDPNAGNAAAADCVLALSTKSSSAIRRTRADR